MTHEAAARIGDPVCHSLGVIGQLGGAVAALAVGAALLGGLILLGPPLLLGVGAALVIAGLTSAGIGAAFLHGPAIMAGLQSLIGLPDPTTGNLCRGSGTILINGLPAIRAQLDASTCNGLWFFQHIPRWSPVLVASGSSSVWFDGQFAGRVKEQLECAAKIKSGSPNVVIGGPSVAVMPISTTNEDELRAQGWWFIDQGIRSFSLGVLAILGANAPSLLRLIRWDEVLFYSEEDYRARVMDDLARNYPTDEALQSRIEEIQQRADTQAARERSQRMGFYGSEQHMRFAERVHEVSGGRISTQDAMDMQPFGGDTGDSTGISTEGILGDHSVTHDVGGFLGNPDNLGVGSGYGGIAPASPFSGQVEGILRESFFTW